MDNSAKMMVRADGGQVCYAEYGDPGGLPIFGFHGTPGSRRFMELFDDLAKGHGARIIAPDRPGYGLSAPVRPRRLVDYTQDVSDLAAHLGVDRFAVMGLSGGGPFALACASHLAPRMPITAIISGIGLLSLPRSTSEMMASNRIMFLLGRFSPKVAGLLLPRLAKSSFSQLDKYIEAGTSPMEDLSPSQFALVAADQREAIHTGGRGIALDMSSFWRPWGFSLEELSAPIIWWHGLEDDLAPTSLARQTIDMLPNCQAIYLEGAGHTGPFSQRGEEIIQRLVAAFD